MLNGSASDIAAVQNRLLAALPEDNYLRLKEKLQPVTLKSGQVVSEPGYGTDFLYFPITSVVSMLYMTEDGRSTQMGIIGNDGLVGHEILIGEWRPASTRLIARIEGGALRMDASQARAEFARGGAFQEMVLRFTRSLLTQISQTAACNGLHTLEQQLCKWLLISHDLAPSDKLNITQDVIADMLGVWRPSVSLVIADLQQAGAIMRSRGSVTIVDRSKLEETACECYKAARRGAAVPTV